MAIGNVHKNSVKIARGSISSRTHRHTNSHSDTHTQLQTHTRTDVLITILRNLPRPKCISVSVWHTGELCKMAELIKMPFGRLTPVAPRNHVLDKGPEIPHGREHF